MWVYGLAMKGNELKLLAELRLGCTPRQPRYIRHHPAGRFSDRRSGVGDRVLVYPECAPHASAPRE